MACNGCGSYSVSSGLCGRCNYNRIQTENMMWQQRNFMQQQQQYMQRPVVMMKPPFNHGAHLVIDLLTCGAWIPFHLILWLVH